MDTLSGSVQISFHRSLLNCRHSTNQTESIHRGVLEGSDMIGTGLSVWCGYQPQSAFRAVLPGQLSHFLICGRVQARFSSGATNQRYLWHGSLLVSLTAIGERCSSWESPTSYLHHCLTSNHQVESPIAFLDLGPLVFYATLLEDI